MKVTMKVTIADKLVNRTLNTLAKEHNKLLDILDTLDNIKSGDILIDERIKELADRIDKEIEDIEDIYNLYEIRSKK